MTGPLEGGDVWGRGPVPHGASPPSSGPTTSLRGPLEPDPQGWEALTQAEAERDTREAGGESWLDGVERRAKPSPVDGFYLVPASDWLGVLDCFRMGERLLAVAERERDQAREALREIVRREAISEYSSIYAAPGEFAALARDALGEQ